MFFVHTNGNSRRRCTAVLCAFVLSLAAGALFTGCSREQAEFKIGFIAPLSGEYEHLRISYLQGAELAVDEVTERGGIEQGKTVIKPVLVVRDNEGATEKAVEYTHELINQEKVSALIGLPFSRNAVPVGKIADRYNIPMITPLSTHPATTKNRHCVYRVCFTDEFQGRLLAVFTFRDLGKGTAAILYDDSMNYSSHLASVYSTHYTNLGGKLVAAEAYAGGETDFRTYLERIRDAEPEVIFLPNFLSDLRMQMQQLRELGISATVIGSDTMDAETQEEKKLLEGAYFCAHFSPDNPSKIVRRFVETYADVYEQRPTYGAALNYDACRLLFTALESAEGRDPESVCRALAGIDTFTGVTGTMDFNKGGDPQKSAVILRWVEMEKRFYKEIQP